MAEEPVTKKQRTEQHNGTSEAKYTLLYHAGLPGRGEPIRLLFEATGTPYNDTAKDKQTSGQVYKLLGDDADISNLCAGSVQPFAPPCLRIDDLDDGQGGLILSQMCNILLFLGTKLNLAGDGSERQKYQVNQLAMTASDLTNEAHDTHHPVAVMDYYEDQKDEALKKSADFRKNRIPKFLGYFERVLKANESKGGGGKYFVGDALTYADLMIWQTLDGLKFAFPKELQARASDYPLLFDTFYPSIKEHDKIKSYLGSDRRAEYSQGIFRHYPELDRQ